MPDQAGPRPAKRPPPARPQRASQTPKAAAKSAPSEPDFDEATYLAAFPDVAEAVLRGDIGSGLDHYRLLGKLERRLQRPEYRQQLGQPRRGANVQPPARVHADVPAFSVEAVAVSRSGALFLAGWTDDRQIALTGVTVRLGRAPQWTWTSFPRVRRTDVEAVVHTARPYHYGFWLVGQDASVVHTAVQFGMDCLVELRFASGTGVQVLRTPVICSDVELRDTVTEYLATAIWCGNRVAESFVNLDQAGDWLVGFNRAITRGIVSGATVTRFGPQRPRYRGSIIVPLYGVGDYLFVQSCTYAQGSGIADYEFVYVINSPELAEQLHREARIAEMIYGLSVSLVTLPDNAGFGAANNVGLQFARSDRVLCVNPDVFPRVSDWAQRHTDLLAGLPAEQTRLFGTTLYYDDGSLMHGGMYFEAEFGLLPTQGRIAQRPMLRVEHYGKGAPPWATQFAASRPVPAVTGAFMSIDRAWFEKLGGFTEDYVFGHYEDADLCLKSLRSGTPVWLHDIPMWHLEGKGSRRLPRHEGGSMLNRWLFTRLWAPLIMPDLIGRTPQLTLQPAAGAPAAASPIGPVRRAPAPAGTRTGSHARTTRLRSA